MFSQKDDRALYSKTASDYRDKKINKTISLINWSLGEPKLRGRQRIHSFPLTFQVENSEKEVKTVKPNATQTVRETEIDVRATCREKQWVPLAGRRIRLNKITITNTVGKTDAFQRVARYIMAVNHITPMPNFKTKFETKANLTQMESRPRVNMGRKPEEGQKAWSRPESLK